jgi:serine/threonine-protein kinase
VQDPTEEQFGDFRIVRRLGQGGMGEVYLAEQISLRRQVAIKVLREDLAANPAALARFEAESKTVAQINHANVVQVYMIGKRQGRSYMVLEYVEGKSLGEYLARQGRLDAPVVLSLMRQVATALHRASELGIVHRDIKPANILLTRKGQAKIADFGLARCLDQEQHVDLTRSGTTVGTPVYMSPEQIEGKPVDARSDIYSFGVTCYHMLAGRPPFKGANAFELSLKHVREEPPPLEKFCPETPPALIAIVDKMLAKKPSARYQSAQELLKDIARVREAVHTGTDTLLLQSDARQTIPKDESSASRPVPVWKRPAMILVGVGVLALGVLAAVLLVVGTFRNRTPDSPEAVLVAAPNLAVELGPPAGEPLDRKKTLEMAVALHLAEKTPNPAGVQDCIDLGVVYLDAKNIHEAKELFARMGERRPPSAYHFVGQLGLAVTDSLENKHRESYAKFASLSDPRKGDNRAQVVKDYLAKNPEFEKWVNEAKSSNVRNGASGSPFSDKHQFPNKRPFKKPSKKS